jgi:hypothetical protein
VIDFRFGRHALGVCAAFALLAGCGGSQTPIGSSGRIPQSHVRSSTSSGGLLYVGSARYGVFMLTYPKLISAGKFQPPSGDVTGLCSDTSGVVLPAYGTLSSACAGWLLAA